MSIASGLLQSSQTGISALLDIEMSSQPVSLTPVSNRITLFKERLHAVRQMRRRDSELVDDILPHLNQGVTPNFSRDEVFSYLGKMHDENLIFLNGAELVYL
jgi:hypothetical protein